jgi:cellulose synthase/poly-beta-1,6-N-acetylglucosamine synthase-like glycosyltransferase/spore germination protein YaaH/peptidoglycan/xylan/chitin deacetylase (PgdA/CDA1 family)
MVFEDPTRKRWHYTVSMFVSITIGVITVFGIAIAGIIIIPKLPIYNSLVESRMASVPASELPVVGATAPDMTKEWLEEQNTKRPNGLTPLTDNKILIPAPKQDKLVSAYIVQSDINSIRSLETNADKIDIAYPDWFTIKDASCAPDTNIDQGISNALYDSKIAIVPRLTNSDGRQVYYESFQAVIASPALTTCLIQNITNTLKTTGTNGLILDINNLSEADSDNYHRFISELSANLHSHNLWLEIVVPAGNRSYNLQIINEYADLIVIGLTGEHYASSKSGPIAGQDWFEQSFQYFYDNVDHKKLMAGIGSYAYDWNVSDTKSTAQSLTYGQAMSIARQSKSFPMLDTTSLNMRYGYRDINNNLHAVWLLDGTVLWNQWNHIKQTEITGLALWRLGSEDETIWSFAGNVSADNSSIKTPPSLDSIAVTGKPEIYHLSNTPKNGTVAFIANEGGYITNARYTSLPSGYELKAVGKENGTKQLVLIIDGGPNPEWTPKILDILDQNQIIATFFVTTPNAERYPELLKVIAARGHVIGNRGGDYVDAATVTREELINNVNKTQKIIQQELLVNTRLYLRQYHSFSLPVNTNDAGHIKDISELGFFIVRANIDAKDWRVGASSEEIINNVRTDLNNADKGTHLLAFQGGGENREETIKAMAVLLPEAKGAGYTFTGINNAVGLSRNDVMPSLERNEAIFARAFQTVSRMANMVWPVIMALFLITTIFSLIRILLMYIFASRSVKRQRKKVNTQSRWVSVLVPAYNEEQTIAMTISALQKSNHKRFEALVINDGSTDKTAEIVEKLSKLDDRIILINKENGGKSSALNLGMRLAKYDIVVTIDGDTILQAQAIDELIKPFNDKKVDAVCGNIEVGNVCNALTAFQALEYITAQNFDRNALEEVNAINVVPGATGAWRRKKIMDLGGYEDDTLTEDADLTIRLLAAGGKIVYAHNARSFTEAPQTLSALAKQRFRWSFGTFQCLAKHYKLFFKGRVGWISLPNIFIFQIIFPLLAPIGDIVFLIALFSGSFGVIFWSYLFFTAMELVSALYAFVIDKKPKRLLLMAFVQRFYYRQFLYITIMRAIYAILRGRRYGWNKLERLGTVLVPA